jgi:RsiW-degrading membrane proteinase PrsW (M82 family)
MGNAGSGSKGKTSVFGSGLIHLLFQILLLIALFLFGRTLTLPDDAGLRFILTLALAGIPSLIWAVFFYLQDRLEPEPLSYIGMAFLSGMAAAALFAIPILAGLIRVDEWIYSSTTWFILGSYCLLAMLFTLLIFTILYLGFYPLKEFDEPADGMVYGAVAGCGYAFVTVFHYLSSRPEITLFVAGYTVSTRVLIYSGVGAMIGYILGREKFSRRNLSILGPIALSVGILLLGTYHLFIEFIFVSGYSQAFWISFVFTMVYAGLILGFCYRKLQQLVETGRTRQISVRRKSLPSIIVFVAILLLTGAVVSFFGMQGKMYSGPEWGVSFRYPHRLAPFSFSGMSQSLSARDTRFTLLFSGETSVPARFRFSVEVREWKSKFDEHDIVDFTPMIEKESMVIGPVIIGGRPGRRIAYSTLSRDLKSPYEFPRLTQVFTDVVPVGGRVFIFTMTARVGDFEKSVASYEKILRSVRWDSETGGIHE